jgi:hypothetical protein
LIQQLLNMLQHIEYKRHIKKRSNRAAGKAKNNLGLRFALRNGRITENGLAMPKTGGTVVQMVWEFRLSAGKTEEFERHYGRIDMQREALTEKESRIGVFETI